MYNLLIRYQRVKQACGTKAACLLNRWIISAGRSCPMSFFTMPAPAQEASRTRIHTYICNILYIYMCKGFKIVTTTQIDTPKSSISLVSKRMADVTECY